MFQAELVTFLINKYFSNLISVLIAYDSSSTSEISELFLDAVQASFQNLTRQGHAVGINLIDTSALAIEKRDFKEMLLQHADIGIEGYITILPSLAEFLNARLYATENSVLRLKDKYYLFLSADEKPEDVLPEGLGDVDNLDPKQPKKSVIYTGSEADIVRSFCQLRNCAINVIPYGNDFWGGVYENGSSDGMIGSVYRHETEFGIGCAYNWFYDIFETSFSIAKSAVPILVPAPSLYPAFMTIILPFNKLIWTLIILSIFASAIVMHVIMYFTYYMEHRNKLEKPHFDHVASYELTQFQIIAIFFQQSFSQSKLDGFAARFFLSTLLLAGLTLENTYSGQLKSLLTIPAVTEPVDTIQKFAATNWKWAAPSEAWIYSIEFSDIPHEKTITKNFLAMSSEEIRDASYRGDFGIGVELLHGGIYSFGDYIRDGNLDQMIMTKDELYFDYSRGFSIKGWPLMHSFNTHVLWVLEHGLYNYWEKKHVYHYLDRETQEKLFNLASGHLQKFPPIPLTIANISGPLFALAIGYSLAFVVLILEMFANRAKKFKLLSKY